MKFRFYPSSFTEDMLLCTGLSYAAGCFNIDTYLSGDIFNAAKLAVCFISVVCWAYVSFVSGLRHRKKFLALIIGWHGVIPLSGFAVTSVRAIKFSSAGLLIHELSVQLSEYPFRLVSKASGADVCVFQVITLALCLLLFSAGHYYTNKVFPADETGNANDERN